MTLEEINLQDSLEEEEIEDILSGITADLVGYESNSPFLERLFLQAGGKWIEIDGLCKGLKEIESQLEELKELFDGTVRVTWLDYPDATCGLDYCIIIFFVEALHWSNLALYNKGLFLRKLTQKTPTST